MLLIVGIFVVRSIAQNPPPGSFRKHMDEYLTDSHDGGGENNTDPKLKVLPIDVNARDVDSIYFDLPADVVAQTPEEVGMIIRIKRATQPVRSTRGRTVNQEFCLLDIVSFPGRHGLTGIVRLEDPGLP